MPRTVSEDLVLLHLRVLPETNEWLRKIAEASNLSIAQVAGIFLNECQRRNVQLTLTTDGWK